MKITLQIEVSNAEELSVISKALEGVSVSGAEVSHPVDPCVVQDNSEVSKPAPAAKKPRGGAKTKTVAEEKEEMIEVPSPYAKSEPHGASVMDMTPVEPLVNTTVKAPETAVGAPMINMSPADFIRAEAKRLEAAQLLPDVKRNIINSLLVEIQAPQGFTASTLPEPYISEFARRFPAKIDATIAQFAGTPALV